MDWENADKWCPPPLHFNISHTSSLVACGVTVNVPVSYPFLESHRSAHNL